MPGRDGVRVDIKGYSPECSKPRKRDAVRFFLVRSIAMACLRNLAAHEYVTVENIVCPISPKYGFLVLGNQFGHTAHCM